MEMGWEEARIRGACSEISELRRDMLLDLIVFFIRRILVEDQVSSPPTGNAIDPLMFDDSGETLHSV